MKLEDLRYWRALAAQGLRRKNTPQTVLPSLVDSENIIWDILVWPLTIGFVVYGAQWLLGIQNKHSGDIAYFSGLWVFSGIIFWPLIEIIYRDIRHRTRIDFRLLHDFSRMYCFIAATTIMFIVSSFILHLVYPNLRTTISPVIKTQKSTPAHHTKNQTSITLTSMFWQQLIVTWLVLTLSSYFWMSRRMKNSEYAQNGKNHQKKSVKKHLDRIPFGLWLGESTGALATLSHGANAAPNQQIGLFLDDLAQNILILGAIGSGKTTRAIHPLFVQLLDQGCGGLVFDIKGDFHRAVSVFTKMTERTCHTLGPQKESFNLLAGLSPEIAASFLKSAFLLGGSGRLDSFWIDTATELCRNTLGVLSFLPEYYSLYGLYCYLFDEKWRSARIHEIDTILLTLDDRKNRLLTGYRHYDENIFSGFDEKVRAGVKATVAQILSPFSHPDLIDAFCTASHNTVNFEDVLNGEVFLVDLPLARWGLGGKVAYTLIKLLFFNIMQNRTHHPEWNQDRYVFFICDEFQEIISANKDGLSDLNFWDKSRSSKTVGIVSAQSVSSFYAALGDRDLTHALLQNFRQKICFRTEDQNTIDMLNRLFGTVEVQRVTFNRNGGRSSSFLEGSSSSHSSSGTSVSTHDKPLLDGQFLRTITSDYAIALMSYNGMSFDDVIRVKPLFIN